MLKALSVRREFFNEKYKLVMDYLYSLRHSNNHQVLISVVELVPFFGEYLSEVFEKCYFGNCAVFFIQSYLNLSASTPLKNTILTS